MFELYGAIRGQWEQKKPIIISGDEERDKIVCIPLSLVDEQNYPLFQELCLGSIKVTIHPRTYSALDLSPSDVLSQNLASRFPILKLLNENHSNPGATGISFDPKAASLNIHKSEMSSFLQDLGMKTVELEKGEIRPEEFKKYFLREVASPGRCQFVLLEKLGLRTSDAIFETASALAVMLGYSSSVLFDFGSQNLIETHALETISKKTVFDLWRSMNKVSKSEISYLSK